MREPNGPQPTRPPADEMSPVPDDWIADFEAAARRPLATHLKYSFVRTYRPVLDDEPYRSFETMEEYGRWCEAALPEWLGYGRAVPGSSGRSPDVAAFDYPQAEEIRDAFARHGVRYLFIGKSGALLLGYSEAGQDVDLFVRKDPENGRAAGAALEELGFALTAEEAADIEQGKGLVRLRNGPFNVDLVFAPDGIESFEEAWARRVDVEGFPVCHPDDIIRSKEAAGRARDRESLPRLRAFRDWWLARRRAGGPGGAGGSGRPEGPEEGPRRL